jgi:hypothetical protein
MMVMMMVVMVMMRAWRLMIKVVMLHNVLMWSMVSWIEWVTAAIG